MEQGVTNELFPNPRGTAPSCDAVGHPEDGTFEDGNPGGDVVKFALFMQLLAPPTPVASFGHVTAASIQRGHDVFVQTGCVLCHTQSLTTGPAMLPALSNQPVNLLSDLLVHNMGPGLADEVSQGNAAGDEFRTAPLWGLGQRLFFLHDGRTQDLVDAIEEHASDGNRQFRDSEANTSIGLFRRLSSMSRQDLLNFLRSL